MRGNFSEKMILTLVPDVGAVRQDGATESAGPRLVIDVALSGKQETGVFVAGELALSGTHAYHDGTPGSPGFVENGDGSTPASYRPLARNLVDLKTLDGHGDVVCGDVKGGGVGGGVAVEGVLS